MIVEQLAKNHNSAVTNLPNPRDRDTDTRTGLPSGRLPPLGAPGGAIKIPPNDPRRITWRDKELPSSGKRSLRNINLIFFSLPLPAVQNLAAFQLKWTHTGKARSVYKASVSGPSADAEKWEIGCVSHPATEVVLSGEAGLVGVSGHTLQHTRKGKFCKSFCWRVRHTRTQRFRGRSVSLRK
jgi:hypothetical protein